ncbi:MAG: hypothetical protein ACWA44_11270 [Thiotrichales bacterium]
MAKKTKNNYSGFEATVASLISPALNAGLTTPCVIPPEFDQSGFYLHADLVFLRADIGNAVLYGREQLDLSREELLELTRLIDTHLRDEGMRFLLDKAGNNFLWLSEELNVSTTPVSAACGKSIYELLPQGPDRSRLHQLINELQMLLHMAPVNQAREAAGKLPANGVWFWEQAVRRAGSEPSDLRSLVSPQGYPVTLAQYYGIAHYQLPENLEALLSEQKDEHVILVLPHLQAASAYDDFFHWHEQLGLLCKQWLEPAQTLLDTRKIQAFTLYTEDGYQFDFQPVRIWNRWKKPVRLLDQL